MKSTRLLIFIIGLIPLTLLSTMMLHAQDQFVDVTLDDCDNLNYLLARDITPYDLTLGGGALTEQISTEIAQDEYADFWSFTLERDVDSVSNITLNTQFQITFNDVSGAPLEFAVYRGMVQLEPFQPVTETTVDYLLRQDGAYTIVVRRVNVAAHYPVLILYGSAHKLAHFYHQLPQSCAKPPPISPSSNQRLQMVRCNFECVKGKLLSLHILIASPVSIYAKIKVHRCSSPMMISATIVPIRCILEIGLRT